MNFEKKKEIKDLFGRLYKMMTFGCNRFICENKFCLRNPDLDSKIKEMGKESKVAYILQKIQSEIDLDNLAMCDFTECEIFKIQKDLNNFSLIEQKTLITNFEQIKLLSQCFYKENKNQDSQEKQTEFDGNIDVQQIIQLSELIQNADKKVQLEINKKIKANMKSIIYYSSQIQQNFQKNDIRYFMILLHLEHLYDFENMDVLSEVIKMVLSLSEGLKSQLQTWLTRLDKESFIRLVELLQNNLTLHIITKYSGEELEEQQEDEIQFNEKENQIEQLCLLMEKFYESNKITKFIEKEKFYNDAIGLNSVDPREQFENWKFEEGDGELCFIYYPFLLELGFKYELLKIECIEEQEKEKEMNMHNMIDMLIHNVDLMSCQFLQIFVRRENLLEDTLNQLSKSNLNFKKELRVQFVGEQGLDEGGVRKELLHLLVKQLFDLDYGMFITKNKDQFYWFNQHSQECSLNFELIGVLLGLAIYNNINLDLRFPPIIYHKLRGDYLITLQDLKDIEPDIYNNMSYILSYEGDLETDLQQTFTITSELYGEHFNHPLKEDGQNILVNKENREEFVQLYLEHTLSISIDRQFSSFLKGFKKVMDSKLISMFSGDELMTLICGQPELDFHELEESVLYKGYNKDSAIIVHFWSLIHSMSGEDQKKFLFFVTGSDRAPVRGLSSLSMIIERHGGDSQQLPSAHTCYNYFLLPEYEEKDTLTQKLYLAINHSEGFGLF